jgi:xanthosine utilization system XapX-like protein
VQKKIAIALASIGIIGVLVSSVLISSINGDTEIYGLGDAANLSCSKLETLDEFFGVTPTQECVDDGAADRRDRNRDRLPLLGGGRIASGVGILLGLILFFMPKFLNNPRKSNPGKSPEAKIEERLRSLSELRDKGLISSDEYASKRQGILEEF